MWQKVFLRKWFYPFAIGTGMLMGFSFAMIKTGWFIVEQIDSLGKDYEISRIIKQDIFDSRPDLNSGMRAQYYMYQQKQKDDFEDRIKEDKARQDMLRRL